MRNLKTLILPFALVASGLAASASAHLAPATVQVQPADFPTQEDLQVERKAILVSRQGERIALIAKERAAVAKAVALAKAKAAKAKKQRELAAARAHALWHKQQAALRAKAAERKRAAARQQIARTTHSAPGGIAACIREHESGGNYGAVNPSSGAGGAYQFLPSTWHGLGYSGLPQNAAPATQDAAFYRLWNGGAGASQWTTAHLCGY